MIWYRKCLVGPLMLPDVVNPRTLELEAAKEILAELYDIQISEVDDLIQQHIADFQLSCMELELHTSAYRSYLS